MSGKELFTYKKVTVTRVIFTSGRVIFTSGKVIFTSGNSEK